MCHLCLMTLCLCAPSQDMDQLQEVWEISQEWDENWKNWKVLHLSQLQTRTMEDTALEMFKRLRALQRDLKVSSAIRCWAG